MESWARQGAFPGVAFVCVCTDQDPGAARYQSLVFSRKLEMAATFNAFGLRKPSMGQLGCSGFIVLRPQDAGIIIKATPSYLQYGPKAHRWVEAWLTQQGPQWMSKSSAAPLPQPEAGLPPPPGPVAQSTCKTCSMKGADVSAAPACSAPQQPEGQGSGGGSSRRSSSDGDSGSIFATGKLPHLASVGHAAMDAEHEECTQALAAVVQQPCQETVDAAISVLQAHFQHEEEAMRACGFGGQGPMSGFQSHCNHHAIILEQFAGARGRLPPSKTESSCALPAAVAEALEGAVRSFYSHAEMYDALYEGILPA